MTLPVDIIVPLGPGSCGGLDEELKVLLRSIERYGQGWRKVVLVATYTPFWLREDERLEVVRMGDPFLHNKDANLFRKLEAGLAKTAAPFAVWTCDDCALVREVDFAELPTVYNERSVWLLERKAQAPGAGKWVRKLERTMRAVRLERGNFDAHCPQRWDVAAALSCIRHTAAEWAVEDPQNAGLGRTVNTGVMGWMFCGMIPPSAVPQSQVKETVESAEAAKSARLDKWFVGYNDEGWRGGLRGRLMEMFSRPSRWER